MNCFLVDDYEELPARDISKSSLKKRMQNYTPGVKAAIIRRLLILKKPFIEFSGEIEQATAENVQQNVGDEPSCITHDDETAVSSGHRDEHEVDTSQFSTDGDNGSDSSGLQSDDGYNGRESVEPQSDDDNLFPNDSEQEEEFQAAGSHNESQSEAKRIRDAQEDFFGENEIPVSELKKSLRNNPKVNFKQYFNSKSN